MCRSDEFAATCSYLQILPFGDRGVELSAFVRKLILDVGVTRVFRDGEVAARLQKDFVFAGRNVDADLVLPCLQFAASAFALISL